MTMKQNPLTWLTSQRHQPHTQNKQLRKSHFSESVTIKKIKVFLQKLTLRNTILSADTYRDGTVTQSNKVHKHDF